MKVIIADTGPIISLVHIGHLDLIDKLLGNLYITKAVWIELTNYENPNFNGSVLKDLRTKVKEISLKNYLSVVMDYGESESVILYEELHADYLLIDDSKARSIAESLGINCIGTLGLLLKAKQKGYISELKPVFEKLISSGRYFSKKLINDILPKINETEID